MPMQPGRRPGLDRGVRSVDPPPAGEPPKSDRGARRVRWRTSQINRAGGRNACQDPPSPDPRRMLRGLPPGEWWIALTDPTPLHRLHKTMAKSFRLAMRSQPPPAAPRGGRTAATSRRRSGSRLPGRDGSAPAPAYWIARKTVTERGTASESRLPGRARVGPVAGFSFGRRIKGRNRHLRRVQGAG